MFSALSAGVRGPLPRKKRFSKSSSVPFIGTSSRLGTCGSLGGHPSISSNWIHPRNAVRADGGLAVDATGWLAMHVRASASSDSRIAEA